MLGPIDKTPYLQRFPQAVELLRKTGAGKWVFQYANAILRGNPEQAKVFLSTIRTVCENASGRAACVEAIAELEVLLAEMGVAAEVAGTIIASATAAVAGAATLVVMLFAFAMFLGAQAGPAAAETAPQDGPEGGGQWPTLDEVLKKLPPRYRGDPTVNPIVYANQNASKWFEIAARKVKNECLCHKKMKEVSILGGDPTYRPLAFAPITVDSFPGQTSPATGMSGTGSGGQGGPAHRPSGGRADPFSFPERGGRPMGVPSDKPKPGETLPFPEKPPTPQICVWPVCRGQPAKLRV